MLLLIYFSLFNKNLYFTSFFIYCIVFVILSRTCKNKWVCIRNIIKQHFNKTLLTLLLSLSCCLKYYCKKLKIFPLLISGNSTFYSKTRCNWTTISFAHHHINQHQQNYNHPPTKTTSTTKSKTPHQQNTIKI